MELFHPQEFARQYICQLESHPDTTPYPFALQYLEKLLNLSSSPHEDLQTVITQCEEMEGSPVTIGNTRPSESLTKFLRLAAVSCSEKLATQ